jgi:hypothetical protein
VSEKYVFIDAEYATAPQQDEAPTVTQMCEWLGVSKSGYYDWRKRPESDTEKRREMLKFKIKAIFEHNNEEYGVPARARRTGPRRRARRRRDRPQAHARACGVPKRGHRLLTCEYSCRDGRCAGRIACP